MENSDDSSEILICRLCLNIVIGKHAVVDDIILEKLENISLEMMKTVPCGSILCEKCDQFLGKHNFLIAQIYKTEQTLMSEIEKTELHLNFKEALSYIDNSSSKEWKCKICGEVNGDTFEDDIVKEALKQLSYNLGFENCSVNSAAKFEKFYSTQSNDEPSNFFNQQGFRIARNLKICKRCTELIYDLISFTNICMNTQEVINNYCTEFEVNNSSEVDLCHVKFYQNYSYSSFGSMSSSVESVSYKPVYEDHELIPAGTDSLSKLDLFDVKLEDYQNSSVPDSDSNKKNHKVLTHELVETEMNPTNHEGVCMYRCPKCNEVVKNIEDHSKQHNNIFSTVKHGCIKCDYTNKFEDNLERQYSTHSQVSISKKNVYSCDKCFFKSRQKGNLKTHMLVHKKPEELNMFKCSKCKFQSRQKGNLKTHLLVHQKPENIMMFKCNECKFQARQKGNLQTHKIRKHGKIK